MKEIWKDIKGYEGLYQVSNTGKIKRTRFVNKNTNRKQERLKVFKLSKDGYFLVALYKNSKGKFFRVNRIVAETFLLNTDNKPEVNHKNGIKTDNNVEKLEWTTRSANHLHRARVLRKGRIREISQYTLDGEYIASYPSIQVASEKTGIDGTNICRVLKGLRNKAGNYKWKYGDNNVTAYVLAGERI